MPNLISNNSRSVFMMQKLNIGIVVTICTAFLLFVLLLFKINLLVVAVIILFVGLFFLLLFKPEIATLFVLFIIYTNLSVLAYKLYNVPQFIAGSMWLIIGLPFVVYVFIRRKQIRIEYPFLLMTAYFGAALLSFFVAKDKVIALNWLMTYVIEGLLLYFLIINVVRNFSILRKAIWILIIAGSLLGGLSLYQDVTKSFDNQFGGLAQRQLRFGLDDDESQKSIKLLRSRAKVRRAQRAEGPLGDPNYYAQIMIVLIPLALFRFFDEKKRNLKILAALGTLLVLSGMLLSYSRGAFLTLGVVVLLLIIFRNIRLYQVLLTLTALLLIIIIASPGYLSRLETLRGIGGIFSNSTQKSTDPVILSRTTEMLAAFTVFLDHPILGVGPGQYRPFYSREYMNDPSISLKHIDTTRAAHSLYFELAAETGLIGFVLFMSIIFYVLIKLWQARRRWLRRNKEYANLATAFFLSIIGYLGTGIFLTLAFQRYFWVLMALAGAALQILNSEEFDESLEKLVL